MESLSGENQIEFCGYCLEPVTSTRSCRFCNPEVIKVFDESFQNEILGEDAKNLSISEILGKCRAWLSLLEEVANTESAKGRPIGVIAGIARKARQDLENDNTYVCHVSGKAAYYSQEVWEVITEAIAASLALGNGIKYDGDILIAVLARKNHKSTWSILKKHNITPIDHLLRTDRHKEAMAELLEERIAYTEHYDCNTGEEVEMRDREVLQGVEKTLFEKEDSYRTTKEFLVRMAEGLDKEPAEENPLKFVIASASTYEPTKKITGLSILEHLVTSGYLDRYFRKNTKDMEEDLLRQIRDAQSKN